MKLKGYSLLDSIILNSMFRFYKFLLHGVQFILIKTVDKKLQADIELTNLVDESNQLKNILGSIVTKTNKSN